MSVHKPCSAWGLWAGKQNLPEQQQNCAVGWSPYWLQSPVLFPRLLPTTSTADGGRWGLRGVQISHLLGEIGLCLGTWATARSLLSWTSCTWTTEPGYQTTAGLFPEYVPLLYEQSHTLFLKLYSNLIQFLIIIPHHAQCVSAPLWKLSLVVNLTPANSQKC